MSSRRGAGAFVPLVDSDHLGWSVPSPCPMCAQQAARALVDWPNEHAGTEEVGHAPGSVSLFPTSVGAVCDEENRVHCHIQ